MYRLEFRGEEERDYTTWAPEIVTISPSLTAEQAEAIVPMTGKCSNLIGAKIIRADPNQFVIESECPICKSILISRIIAYLGKKTTAIEID
ncbi:MAG: hypothetical protein WC468_00890 [Candidatus Paceibacterota bacterium]